MEKDIRTLLKSNLTLKSYSDLFDVWNSDRCADGMENSFDLDDFKDYELFVNAYNLETAFNCKNQGRFWIGGMNFPQPKPFPNNIEDAKDLICKCIDYDRIMNSPKIYKPYFNINTYAPNNNHMYHPLEYPVVLQFFTTYWWEYIILAKKKYTPFKDDVTKNDILDMVANLAYDFWQEYKFTEWETTFDDYALHYIVRKLEIKSELFDNVLNYRNEVYDEIINFFKHEIGGYYTESLSSLFNDEYGTLLST